MRILSMGFLCIIVFFVSINAQQNKGLDEKTAWVNSVIEETSKIKSGMTRSELLKVFVEEGGLSTSLNRTYVYRACPLIKVDVGLSRLADLRETLKVESPLSKTKEIL